MKKIILMAALMLSSVATFAQRAVGSWTIQPKIGLNIASLTNNDGSDPRIGFVGGAEFEYQAADIVGISAGALYSMQGCKVDGNGSTYTTKLDYINIPILANIYVVDNLAVKFGIQPGFNVNSKAKYTRGDASAEDGIENMKTVDFTIPIGLSYEFSNIVIDARYNFGLTKVSSDADCKNSVFQITVGYKIDL